MKRMHTALLMLALAALVGGCGTPTATDQARAAKPLTPEQVTKRVQKGVAAFQQELSDRATAYHQQADTYSDLWAYEGADSEKELQRRLTASAEAAQAAASFKDFMSDLPKVLTENLRAHQVPEDAIRAYLTRKRPELLETQQRSLKIREADVTATRRRHEIYQLFQREWGGWMYFPKHDSFNFRNDAALAEFLRLDREAVEAIQVIRAEMKAQLQATQ